MLFPSFFNAGAPTYEIEQSLRFDGSSYLSRTPSAAGTLGTWTISFWAKRGKSGFNSIFNSGSVNQQGVIYMTNASDVMSVLGFNSTGAAKGWSSYGGTGKLRDFSAWYHVLIRAFSSSSSNSYDGVELEIYINGEETGTTMAAGSPSGGCRINDGQAKTIGYNAPDGNYFNGYIAEWHLVDGTAAAVTDFGKFDSNGVWRPIEYTGSHGTQGYYLKFDPTATNGIGHDHSGNGNNWTPTGFTTSGTGTDVMSDTPTMNWCTLNPLEKPGGTAPVYENGNLTLRNSTNYFFSHGVGTFGLNSGKWYFETSGDGSIYTQIGFVDSSQIAGMTGAGGISVVSRGWSYQSNGVIRGVSNTYQDTALTAASTAGDTMGLALDFDAGEASWYVNGTQVGSTVDFSSYLSNSRTWYPVVAVTNEGTDITNVNFGQRDFAYPLGTSSATEHFNAVTYSGVSGDKVVTGLGFKPDLVWIKSTDTVGADHELTDSVRGVTKALHSNTAGSEDTFAEGLQSFDTDGFTLGDDHGNYNRLGREYVAWCWKAGGTASSNTDGTITSTVSANPDAGFSIVSFTGKTYTGNSSTDTGTVGHGLGVAPSFIIVKTRNGTSDWICYHSALGNTKYIELNYTNAATPQTGMWASTSPTNDVFTMGPFWPSNIADGKDMIAYCFAEKTGVNKIGSYDGNGSPDGPFIETGFSPSMIIVKRVAGGTGGWIMLDKARDSTNPNDTRIEAQSSYSNYTIGGIDFQPNGFKLRTNNGEWNASGSEYIYIAFAENFTADDTFKSLNTANLSAPTVKDGSDYFNTVLYTGNGSTQTITGLDFNPDFVWFKSRNNSYHHALVDAVRGVDKYLYSSLTIAEETQTTAVSSFNSNGFSFAGNFGNVNNSGTTYAAWAWDAGNSTSSNTDGSITSTVSVNPSAGFSIVSYVGTQAAGTIGHGLNVAPSMIICKDRDVADRWPVYHSALGNAKNLRLDNTTGEESDSTIWNSTSPASTVFSVGANVRSNRLNSNYIAYCFTEVENYSKFGVYTGNGSSDGPFVYCGFKPAWLLMKNTGTANWLLLDVARGQYYNPIGYKNSTKESLYANSNVAESGTGTGFEVDFLSNGFKCRASVPGELNESGSTYIFAAFAENPFGGDGVPPATAR